MPWQKRARMILALFGLSLAFALYVFMGEREASTPAAAPARLDPKAIIESSDALFRQVRGVEQDYEVKVGKQLTYDDGSSKLFDVQITVRGREGRDFVMTGREALAGKENRDVTVSGNVTLVASDGFELRTDHAVFSDADGLVRAPGALRFQRGRMSGSGVGMTYDKNNDVLTISDQSKVTLTGEDGSTVMEFVGGSATLARHEDYLLVERSVHARREEQVIESDRAMARLTANEEQITFMELRGNSRVTGGSTAFQAMSARDIDLDYTDDGELLERVALAGSGTILLTGADGGAGRQLAGESVDVVLATDGAVTAVTARENVRMDQPATRDMPARSVTARTLDASGEPGKGLTSARFAQNVEYREESASSKQEPRVARSQALQTILSEDAIRQAVFSGNVTFSEAKLRAAAAEARYDPQAGTLALSGRGPGGSPHVADTQVDVRADAVDVTLEGPRMIAKGSVKTILKPSKEEGTRLPGLFKEGQDANATATALDYDGTVGRALYTGNVQMWQGGDTAVRADRLLIDRTKGDLEATGQAKSTLTLNTGSSISTAEEIRYEDATRQVHHLGVPPPPKPSRTPGAVPGGGAVVAPTTPIATRPPAPAHLSGPEGDLRGDRIVLSLGKSDNAMERLEATGHVTLKLDVRSAAGANLVYAAADERYVVSGVSGELVTIVENCRETRGKTLTFFRSTDRIIVDGNQEIRTQTKSDGGPCPGTAK